MTEEEFYQRQQYFEDMIMARQQQQAPTPVVLSEEVAQEELRSPVEIKKATLELNMILGSIQGIQAIANLATAAMLTQLQRVKEEKAYKGVELLSKATGEVVIVNTWEDFCSYGLGKTRARIDEQLQNLNAFGAEALEEMQQMGITSKQFRQLRALAKEDENNVIEVIANVTTTAQTDIEAAKEQLLELIDKQAEKHTREKDALKKAQEEAEKQAKQKEEELQAQLQRAERTVKNKEQALADANAMLAKKIDRINQLEDEKHEQETLSVDMVESNLIAGFAEYGHRLINGAIAQRADEPFLGAVGLRQVVNKLKDFYTKEKGEPDIPSHIQLQIVDFAKQMNAVLEGVIEDFNLDNSGIGEYEDVEYVPEPTNKKTFL